MPRRASTFSRISIQSCFFRGNDLCRAYFAAFGLGSHGASDCRIGENHRGVCGTRVVEGEAIPLIGFLVESHRVRGCRTGGAKRDRDLSSAPFPGEICASLPLVSPGVRCPLASPALCWGGGSGLCLCVYTRGHARVLVDAVGSVHTRVPGTRRA